MSRGASGFRASSIRAGHPDFLDLPWDRRVEDWAGRCDRLENLPRGESRHPVVFVGYDNVSYALKVTEPGRAEHEFDVLRQMEGKRLPAVDAVGHLEVVDPDGERSVLVTQYLAHSLPYHALFTERSLAQYQTHLLDALAGLLVQLHVAGTFWGDCSLANTLFLRDAGTLNAYLVDAETSAVHEQLSDGQRRQELVVMEENMAGSLYDLIAGGRLSENFAVAEAVDAVRSKYEALWDEIHREELLAGSDRFLVEERIRKLNALGFSVGAVEFSGAEQGVKVRAVVTDRTFHRELLHGLTGLAVQERQAQLMMNEIRQVRAWLSQQRGRSVSLSGAAYHWLEETFRPIVRRLEAARANDDLDAAELYCQLLEHKWYLSEAARRDVGYERALDDYLHRISESSVVLPAANEDPETGGGRPSRSD